MTNSTKLLLLVKARTERRATKKLKRKEARNMSNNLNQKNIRDKTYSLSEEEWRKITFNKYIKNPPDVYKFSKHLISFIDDIAPKEELLLFYFLQITLNYVNDYWKDTKFDLLTFGLMADILIPEQDSEALFDELIKERLEKTTSENHNVIKSYYNLFTEARDENSPRVIVEHIFTIIENYIPPEE